MNTKTKAWLCAAVSLILFGILLFGGVMMALSWNFTKLSTVRYETKEHAVEASFRHIRIETDTADISLVPTENRTVSVVCYETEKQSHTVSAEDGTLTVSLRDTRKWYEYIGINIGSPKITVYLPEGEYGALFIKESTGNIEIPRDFSFDSMDISASTGSVACHASASGDMKIKTSTGRISVENVSAGELSLSVSTGKTELTGIRCKNLLSTGSTGRITLTDVIADGRISIERSTGDVTLTDSDGGEISIKTDTGDVTGTLLSEKTFITHTDTGRIRIPKSVTGGRCEITTDTGNIRIDIK